MQHTRRAARIGGTHLLARLRRARSRLGRGFTLIELLIVVVIISVIAAVAVPALLSRLASTQDEAADVPDEPIRQAPPSAVAGERPGGGRGLPPVIESSTVELDFRASHVLDGFRVFTRYDADYNGSDRLCRERSALAEILGDASAGEHEARATMKEGGEPPERVDLEQALNRLSEARHERERSGGGGEPAEGDLRSAVRAAEHHSRTLSGLVALVRNATERLRTAIERARGRERLAAGGSEAVHCLACGVPLPSDHRFCALRYVTAPGHQLPSLWDQHTTPAVHPVRGVAQRSDPLFILRQVAPVGGN